MKLVIFHRIFWALTASRATIIDSDTKSPCVLRVAYFQYIHTGPLCVYHTRSHSTAIIDNMIFPLRNVNVFPWFFFIPHFSRIQYLKASGGFRRSFMYSNLMYGLVTRITEIIGNSTWEALVRRELFRPLGMESSTFSTTADPNNIDYARGYFDANETYHAVPWELTRWIRDVSIMHFIKLLTIESINVLRTNTFKSNKLQTHYTHSCVFSNDRWWSSLSDETLNRDFM